MSDYNSSLPIYTREVANTSSEHICVAGWESGGSDVVKIKVDTAGQVYVIASDLDIRDIVANNDSIQIYGLDGSNLVPISVDSSGNLQVDVISGGGGYQYQDGVANTGAYGTVAMGDDGMNLQFLKVDNTGRLQIDIAAQTLTAVKISKDASANSETNPIFVKVVDVALANEIHDYDTTTNVGASNYDDHVYALPIGIGNKFLLRKVCAAASGAMKIEILVGPSATLATKAVLFTSSAKLYEEIEFTQPIEITEAGAGERVVVRRTNRDRQSMDVYSTVMGTLI